VARDRSVLTEVQVARDRSVLTEVQVARDRCVSPGTGIGIAVWLQRINVLLTGNNDTVTSIERGG